MDFYRRVGATGGSLQDSSRTLLWGQIHESLHALPHCLHLAGGVQGPRSGSGELGLDPGSAPGWGHLGGPLVQARLGRPGLSQPEYGAPPPWGLAHVVGASHPCVTEHTREGSWDGTWGGGAETHGQGAQVGLLGLAAAAAGPSGQGPLLQPAQQHGQHQVAHGLLGTQGPPQAESVAAGKGGCEGGTETPACPA